MSYLHKAESWNKTFEELYIVLIMANVSIYMIFSLICVLHTVAIKYKGKPAPKEEVKVDKSNMNLRFEEVNYDDSYISRDMSNFKNDTTKIDELVSNIKVAPKPKREMPKPERIHKFSIAQDYYPDYEKEIREGRKKLQEDGVEIGRDHNDNDEDSTIIL